MTAFRARAGESGAHHRAVRPAATRSAPPSASSPPCSAISPRMLQQKSRLAALGLAVSKINHDLRNLLASAQLFSDRLASLPDPRVQRFAPKLMRALERAIAFCQSTLSYGRAQEPPPDRRWSRSSRWSRRCARRSASSPTAPIALDRRGRARPDGRRRSRPAVPHPAQPRAQRRAGAGEPRAQRSRPRPDPHHRPARGRGGGDRGLRHRARRFRRRRASICSRRSRARPAPAAPASALRSRPSWCAPMAATSAWSKAPSARPSRSPSRTARSSSKPPRRARAGLSASRAFFLTFLFFF